ncbi:MAG: hypothetical protein P9M14_17515, partial [Candidatus Alcyoniella australis]|nr:hypothetical protein [Candidatus Alcyoniella australis]
MRAILGILLLGLIAVAGSLLVGRRDKGKRKTLSPLRTGMLFLPLGVLLGPRVSGVFGPDALAGLEPIKILGLGWIGFLYGLHLELRFLRRVSLKLYVLGMGQSIAALAAVFAVLELIGFARGGTTLANDAALIAVSGTLILAACASGSSPTRVFWLASRWRSTSATSRALQIVSSLDDLPGLLLFGMF